MKVAAVGYYGSDLADDIWNSLRHCVHAGAAQSFVQQPNPGSRSHLPISCSHGKQLWKNLCCQILYKSRPFAFSNLADLSSSLSC